MVLIFNYMYSHDFITFSQIPLNVTVAVLSNRYQVFPIQLLSPLLVRAAEDLVRPSVGQREGDEVPVVRRQLEIQ